MAISLKFWGRKSSVAVRPNKVTAASMEENGFVLWTQRWLIEFMDAVLVRVCQFFLMLGFIAGTIATLSTRFNINASPWFNMTWAIVQAVAIDGLFFAVWSIWKQSVGKGWLRAWYFFIGVLLGAVAALVNDIVSFSELRGISTIALAMRQLGIEESTFSLCRSGLVVLVSILIVTLPRGQRESIQPVQVSAPQIDIQELVRTLDVRIVETIQSTLATLPAQVPVPQIEAAVSPSEEEEGVQNADAMLLVTPLENPIHHSKIEVTGGYGDAIEALVREEPNITAKAIVERLGCSHKTAYNWMKRVRVPV